MLRPLLVEQPLPTHGHRDDFAAAGLQRLGHQFKRGVFARADKQPTGKFKTRQFKRLHRRHRAKPFSTPADKGYDLNRIIFRQRRMRMVRPANELIVAFDGRPARIDPQGLQQRRHGHSVA